MSQSKFIAQRAISNPASVTAPVTKNPFMGLTYETLDQSLPDLTGKKFLDVINGAAEHMREQNIMAASILCTGESAKKSKRYLVNLNLAKEQHSEVFKGVTDMHYLIHSSAGNFPHIVIIKAEALAKLN